MGHDLDTLRAFFARSPFMVDLGVEPVAGAPGRITWFDMGGHGTALSSTPVDLSHVFRVRIFESVPSVVLTRMLDGLISR